MHTYLYKNPAHKLEIIVFLGMFGVWIISAWGDVSSQKIGIIPNHE